MESHSPSRRRLLLPGLLAAAAALMPSALPAQQLEPRAFAPNPVGVSFLSVSTGRTKGDVLLDAAAPIKDFEVDMSDGILGYARTFALGDRLASIGVVVPYLHGDASGIVNGEPREVSRAGWGDVRVRLSTSLLPGSAQDPAAFAAAPPTRTLGASLVVAAPTGQYYAEKLVNIGSNRWAFKPEIGGAIQFRQWSFDGSAGVWFFTDNNDFFGGSRKSQDPVGVLQGHIIYIFAPRLWFGLGLTGYAGGETEVDGNEADDRQENTRVGLVLALPLGRQHSLKFGYSQGARTRAGGDFDYYSVAWQYLWFH